MISLPVIPSTIKLSELFPHAVVVYAYNKISGYVRIRGEDDLEVGKGYWILLNNAQNYKLTGKPIYDYTLNTNEDGWEMIGGCTYPAETFTNGCNIKVIYGYDKVSGYKLKRVFVNSKIFPNEY